MKQYIDKTVIEKILHKLWKEDKGYGYVDTARSSYNEALQKVQCEIDVLEDKEVDFVKEFYTFSEKHKLMDKGIEFADIEKTASFFFQLGLSASNPITAADRGIQLPVVTVKEAIERKIINSPFALKGAYSGKMYFYSWKKSISKMPENIANLKLSMNYDFNKGKELGSYNIEPMVRFIESSFSNKPFLEPYILVWVSDYELSKKGE